jgi:ABC-type enterochelin transport system substrate-binding protein
MRKTTIILLVGFLLLAGCEKQQEQQQGDFEQVPERIEQIKADVQEQQPSQADRHNAEEPTDDIKITVTILTVDEQDFKALDSLWAYTSDGFVLKRRLDIFPESGLKVNMAVGNLSAKLAAVRENAKHSERTEMSLVLADGATGYINLGTGIPMPQFHYLTRTYNAADYNFQRVDRGFKVRARRVPERDLINLSLTPVLSGFLKDGSDKEFNELWTGITVKPGQSILIGGTRASRDNFPSALLSLRKEEDTVVLVNASFL